MQLRSYLNAADGGLDGATEFGGSSGDSGVCGEGGGLAGNGGGGAQAGMRCHRGGGGGGHYGGCGEGYSGGCGGAGGRGFRGGRVTGHSEDAGAPPIGGLGGRDRLCGGVRGAQHGVHEFGKERCLGMGGGLADVVCSAMSASGAGGSHAGRDGMSDDDDDDGGESSDAGDDGAHTFDVIVKQAYTSNRYGYEYLGSGGRLVLTPQTDRCFLTLTTAMHMHLGGAVYGASGAGKTATVRDLARRLGIMCFMVQCSGNLDGRFMERIISGAAQCGIWACFDELTQMCPEVRSQAERLVGVVLC
eukprot:6200707-Pleurochrysis_carterae.AAC.12